MTRARLAALACALLAAACTPFGDDGDEVDRQAALKRYVEVWAEGGDALARTVGGGEADELVKTLEPLPTGGVTQVRVVRTVASDDGLRATVALEFADGGALELSMHVTFTGDRVRAEPAAVSTALSDWERLRIEARGPAPRRGDVRSRSGTRLAHGPESERVVLRPGLAPAVAAIDAALDGRLGGQQGRRLLAGEGSRVLAESRTVDGEDVRTSLDDGAQMAAEAALGRRPGAFVAVDPRTAGIRALVSNATAKDPDRSPATSAYSPGSAFKIVTAAAALEHDVLDPSDRISCPSRVFVEQRFITNFESIAYGPITFEKAFAVSCNTAFAQIGPRIGASPLLRTAERLGFRVGPKLDGAASIAAPRNRGELAVWSFGAAGSLTSPVHLAGIGAAIARGGTWLAARWTDSDDPGRPAIAKATASMLVDFMEAVVETGTGRSAAIRGARIAGKTGTADPQEEGDRSDAWFVALAPSRNPNVVAVALVIGGGVGGEAAAPVVRSFLITTEPTWR